MAAKFDAVVYHGLPMHDQPHLLQERLQGSLHQYSTVSPALIFQENPGFGVRDITNKVVSLLRQHKKVIVEDTNASAAITHSLLKVIREKVPRCTVLLLHVTLKHGKLQAQWDREFLLASGRCELPEICSDETIDQWFDENGECLQHSYNNLRTEKLYQAYSRETVQADFRVSCDYKFEVPALLIQWECAVDGNGQLVKKLTDVCQHWSKAHPCGRIVLVCDGCSVARGLLTSAQERLNILQCTRALAHALECPVYVLQIVSKLEAGEFCTPPSPGILAFLQRRHLLDLHHRKTVYMYKDSKHMKMAERAGIRHFEFSKLLSNPQMMSSCHGAVCTPVPAILKQMKVLQDKTGGSDEPEAHIPLIDHIDEFDNNFICVDHLRGHREYVFAKDVQVLQRYQNLYRQNATRVGEEGSRLQASHSRSSRTASNQSRIAAHGQEEGEVVAMPREIPKWMVSRGESGSSVALAHSAVGTLEKTSSTSSTEGHYRARRTLYVMTERELLEMAQGILREAGKGVLLHTSEQQTVDAPSTAAHHQPQETSSRPKASDTHHHAQASLRNERVPDTGDEHTDLADRVPEEECTPRKKSRLAHSNRSDAKTHHQRTETNDPETSTSGLDTEKSDEHPTRVKKALDWSVLDEIFS